jgi:hypothetical protein
MAIGWGCDLLLVVAGIDLLDHFEGSVGNQVFDAVSSSHRTPNFGRADSVGNPLLCHDDI